MSTLQLQDFSYSTFFILNVSAFILFHINWYHQDHISLFFSFLFLFYFFPLYRGCEPYILKLESVTVSATGKDKDKENKIFRLTTYNSLQVHLVFSYSYSISIFFTSHLFSVLHSLSYRSCNSLFYSLFLWFLSYLSFSVLFILLFQCLYTNLLFHIFINLIVNFINLISIFLFIYLNLKM